MLSSLKSQKYACVVMRPFSQSNLTYKTSSQIEHTHLWNRDFKCHIHTLKFETPTSHFVCFSPVWPSHLGPCPFSPWKWHFTFSAPGNGILSLTPLGTIWTIIWISQLSFDFIKDWFASPATDDGIFFYLLTMIHSIHVCS